VARLDRGWEDGKRKIDAFYAPTKLEAERRLRDALHDLDRGQNPIPQTLTVAQWLDTWQAGKLNVRPATARRYEQVVQYQLVPKLGHTRLARLTAGDVSNALRALQAEGVSARSVFLARTVLRAALGDAVRKGVLVRNVAADAEPPRVEDREPIVLHPSAVAAILHASDPELRRAVTVAVHTGLRFGEQFGLTWAADVDFEHRCVYVRQGLVKVRGGGQTLGPFKTRRSLRVVPLTDAALSALDEERVAQTQAREAAGANWSEPIPGLVFTDDHGSPRNGGTVLGTFQAALRRAGLPPMRWHDLRGAHAGLLLASGTDLAVISKRLGHSSVAITARTYAGVADVLQVEAAERLGRLLGAGNPGNRA
jgi:integrase